MFCQFAFTCTLNSFCYTLIVPTCIIYFSGTTLRDTNVCEGIRVGDEVQFEVTLEATHCVEKRDFILRIGPSGLDETLIVNVKVLCDCDCEQEVGISLLLKFYTWQWQSILQDRIVENAEECHGGDMVCGVCRCKGGNVGRYCECNRPGMSTAALNEKCKRLVQKWSR